MRQVALTDKIRRMIKEIEFLLDLLNDRKAIVRMDSLVELLEDWKIILLEAVDEG